MQPAPIGLGPTLGWASRSATNSVRESFSGRRPTEEHENDAPRREAGRDRRHAPAPGGDGAEAAGRDQRRHRHRISDPAPPPAAALIDRTLSIPTIPRALAEAQQLAADPDCSLVAIAEVIERDPAIATQALRIANTPFYGLTHPVSSVRMTCVVLGLDALLNLVRQAAVLQLFAGAPSPRTFDCERLWNHSFACALAARYLAMGSPSGGRLGPETAYTCGLLQHVGKMVILHGLPGEIEKALALSDQRQQPLRHALRAVLGFDDADVLSHLARRWNLGDELEQSARTPDASAGQCGWTWSTLVRAADVIARDVAAVPPGWRADAGARDVLAAIPVEPELYGIVCATVRDTVAPACR
jgi:HD-like signal output (HDOD) protein